MTALVGGFIAACCWGVSILFVSRSSKLIGGSVVAAWVQLSGFVLLVPLALARGVPDVPTRDWGFGLLGGACAAVGLTMYYMALRTGKAGVVAPILASAGGIAAVVSVALGEPLGRWEGTLLAAIAVGCILVALDRASGDASGRRRAVAFAGVATALYALQTLSVGRAGDLDPIWLVAAARTIGVAVIAAPIVLGGRLTMTRRALPFVAVSCLLEIVGFVAFVVAAADHTAIAAVASGQFAVVAAVGGFLVLGERLATWQWAGVVLTVAGISALTLVQVA